MWRLFAFPASASPPRRCPAPGPRTPGGSAVNAKHVEGGSFVHYLMAASVVALFPLLILFFLAQRYITKGLLLTGSKG